MSSTKSTWVTFPNMTQVPSVTPSPCVLWCCRHSLRRVAWHQDTPYINYKSNSLYIWNMHTFMYLHTYIHVHFQTLINNVLVIYIYLYTYIGLPSSLPHSWIGLERIYSFVKNEVPLFSYLLLYEHWLLRQHVWKLHQKNYLVYIYF